MKRIIMLSFLIFQCLVVSVSSVQIWCDAAVSSLEKIELFCLLLIPF